MPNNEERYGYEGYERPAADYGQSARRGPAEGGGQAPNQNPGAYGYGQQVQPTEAYGYGGQAQQPQQPQQSYQPQQPQQSQQPRQNAGAYGYARQSQPAAGGYVPAMGASASRNRQRQQAAAGAQNSYAQYSRNAGGYYANAQQGMSRGKKIAIVVIVIALLAAVAGGAAYAFTQMRKAEVNADLHNMDENVLEAIDAQLTGQTSFTEPFTVLLLGSDEREDDEAGDVGGARTDTIILVRVNPTTKEVDMVSIPRDTMVNLPGVGTAKINAAYYYGGAPATIEAVKNLTGVEIDHYAFVNFGGLVDLVNAIGGIDVYVDETVDNPKAGNVIVEAGQQHLDGEHALTLARDRDYADGDYTRQVNQRKVIMGIIERVMNAPASDLAGLIQASTGFVTTDSGITFDWILSLAQQMRHVEDNHDLQVKSISLPSTPAYIGEVSYVIADVAATAELMQIFMACGDITQPLTQSSIASDVAAAGGSYGGATTIQSEETYYYEETTVYEEPAGGGEPAPAAETGGGEGGGAGEGGGNEGGGSNQGGSNEGGNGGGNGGGSEG